MSIQVGYDIFPAGTEGTIVLFHRVPRFFKKVGWFPLCIPLRDELVLPLRQSYGLLLRRMDIRFRSAMISGRFLVFLCNGPCRIRRNCPLFQYFQNKI